jgi:hypothetical protein
MQLMHAAFMQQPSRSSPGALVNKATIMILPCEDKMTVGANQDDSDPKSDMLTQPSPAKKRRHNDAVHLCHIFEAWGHIDDSENDHESI